MSNEYSAESPAAGDIWRQRAQRAFEWLVGHYRRMVAALVLFLAALAALLFLLSYQDRLDQKAAYLFKQAEEIYQRETPRRAATPAAPAKKGVKPESSKVEEVDEAAYRRQLQEAADKFAEVSRQFPRSRMSPLADLYQAICRQRLGQVDAAAVLMEQALPRLPGDSAVQLLAAQRLGLTQLDRGDFAQAAELFQRLARDKKGLLRDQFLFYEGEALRQLGKKEEAKDRYLMVEKFDPPSPLADRARQRIASLDRSAGPSR